MLMRYGLGCLTWFFLSYVAATFLLLCSENKGFLACRVLPVCKPTHFFCISAAAAQGSWGSLKIVTSNVKFKLVDVHFCTERDTLAHWDEMCGWGHAARKLCKDQELGNDTASFNCSSHTGRHREPGRKPRSPVWGLVWISKCRHTLSPLCS